MPKQLPIFTNQPPPFKQRANPSPVLKQTQQNYGNANSNLNRRFSIFVKNIPSAKLSIDAISKFFSQFGSLTNVNLDERKNACVVKFKEVFSAERAANFKGAIMADPNVKIVYNMQTAEQPEEDDLKKKSLIKRKEQELSIKEELDKNNADIQKFLKELNQAGLNRNQTCEIELKINNAKANIRDLIS